MNDLQIILIDTINNYELIVTLPTDIPLEQLIPALADKLELSGGNYTLTIEDHEDPMPENSTLAEFHLLENTYLILKQVESSSRTASPKVRWKEVAVAAGLLLITVLVTRIIPYLPIRAENNPSISTTETSMASASQDALAATLLQPAEMVDSSPTITPIIISETPITSLSELPIAFQCFLDDWGWGICFIDQDGTNLIKVKVRPSSDLIVYSPDGKWLALVARSDAGEDIFLITTGSDDVTQLTNSSSIERDLSWSPDSKKLAYHDSDMGLVRINIADKQSFELALGKEPDWSPSGDKLGYRNNRELLTISSDGSQQKTLANSSGPIYDPEWSPDGLHITFIIRENEDSESLNIIQADGSDLMEIAHQSSAAYPRWSPDGDWIAFYACREKCGIYLVKPDGSELSLLALADWQMPPAWSPDGSSLAYIVGFDRDIAVVDISSGESVNLTENLFATPQRGIFPAWAP